LFHIAFVSIQYYKKHNIVDCLFIDCLFIACLIIAEEDTDDWRYLKVKAPDGITYDVKVLGSDTIFEAKSMMALDLGIAQEDFSLVFNGKRLEAEDMTVGLVTHLAGNKKIHVSMDMTGGGNYIVLDMEAF